MVDSWREGIDIQGAATVPDIDKQNLWETEDTREPAEQDNLDESDFIPEIDEDVDSKWLTENGSLKDMNLNDVIKYHSYNERDVSRTGIRSYPLGLRLAWRIIGRKKSLSTVTVQMHNSKHGMAIVLQDERIKTLFKAYVKKERLTITGTGDPVKDKELIRSLEERAKISFVNPLTFDSSIAMDKNMVGPLAKLSDALAMPNATVYCFLCMLSVDTINIGQAVKTRISEELSHFWNKIEERTKTLQ